MCKGSDQPAHTCSLIRAFASLLNILWLLSNWPNIIGVSKLKRRLLRLVWVYTCQNATLMEIRYRVSFGVYPKFFTYLLLSTLTCINDYTVKLNVWIFCETSSTSIFESASREGFDETLRMLVVNMIIPKSCVLPHLLTTILELTTWLLNTKSGHKTSCTLSPGVK